MRTLALALLGLAACSSDNKDTPIDGPPIKLLDAAPDAAPDAFIPPPPDAPPTYDFSCLGMAQPTTATDPVHASGSTESVGQGGLTAASDITVETFKVGGAQAVDTVVSDSMGNFTTGAIATGKVPFDGYLRASNAAHTYRTSYLYPSAPLAADLTGAPVFLVTPATFQQLGQFLGAQDDTKNGALLVAVTDCSSTQVAGATLTVTQNGASVGTVFDLSTLSAQANGLFFVLNVPAGTTNVKATLQGKTYPGRDVTAYKADTENPNGTVTVTNLRPGP